MNELEQLVFGNSTTTALDPIRMIISLFVGFLISFLIVYHYRKFSSSLTNRMQLTKIFPILILTLILVISIIKTSLALSLGLVGALSIVRFRTPIKEPEELMYLFLCIGVGIGLGSGQIIITIITTFIILFLTGFYRYKFEKNNKNSLIFNINVENVKDPVQKFKNIEDVFKTQSIHYVIKRFETQNEAFNAILIVDIKNEDSTSIVNRITEKAPDCLLSVIDQNELLIP